MHISRRTLFGAATSAALASAAAPVKDGLKARFLLDSSLIYMNAANIAPCFAMAMEAYQKQLVDFQSNPAFQNREKYKQLSETVRGKLAAWVKASPEEIAITRNTSESNNLIPQGVGLRAGDEILLTEHNHPSNHYSWELRAKQAGAKLVMAPVPIGARTATEVFDSVARGVTAKTRVIAVSHFTNTTGLLYPVKMLAELARQKGLWLHVDGAQSFGWMALDLPGLGMDSFSGSFHKWPMGPLESGMLYVRKERLAELSPAILSVDYWAGKPEGARKFEQLGQRDDAKLTGMDKTMDALAEIGRTEIEAKALEIAGYLREQMLAAGFTVRGSGAKEVSGPVVKVNPKGDLGAVYEKLWTKDRLAIAKTDSGEASGLRFSPHIYNTKAEVDAVVKALKRG